VAPVLEKCHATCQQSGGGEKRGLAVVAGFALPQDEFDVVLDDAVWLVGLAAAGPHDNQAIVAYGDCCPDTTIVWPLYPLAGRFLRAF
jgi:hypothetical protein